MADSGDTFRAIESTDVRGSRSKPAVGIDATDREASVETFVRTVARAAQRNSHVLVAAEPTDTDLLSRLQAPNVTVIEVSDTAADVRTEFCTTGKEMGFPGVLIHPSPASELQYAESYDIFRSADDYVIPASVSDATPEETLIAGILASAEDDRVGTLAARARKYVDEVLVINVDNSDEVRTVAERAGASVIEIHAEGRVASLRTLFTHIQRQYAEFEAFVLLAGDAQYDPAHIPSLVKPISDGDADFVIGERATRSDPTESSLGSRVRDRLRDRFTLGAADRKDTTLQSGLQALSPEAVSRLEVSDEVRDAGPELVNTAIRADLDVHVTDLEREPDRADHRDRQIDFLDTEESADTDLSSPEDYILDADSSRRPALSVVIPTMNEEEGIETCMEWVHEAVAELRVPTEILVSDSSTDRTPEIAREWGAIVVEPDEPGYGYAYRYAFERARGDYIVMGDADTTYDFSEIPRLLNHLDETGADMVMGSRLEGTIEPGAMPALHRYVGNPLLTRFLNTFYDAGVSDAHSGFRVFRAGALARMDLQTDGMEFASEMIMEATTSGLDIEEVPITYHEREGEETLDSFRDGWRHVRFMLVNAPSYLFSLPGLVLSLAGLVVMALASTGIPINGISLGPNSMIAGSLSLLVGYQVACLGIFAAITGDPIKQPADAVTEWINAHLSLERGATVGLLVFGAGAAYAGSLFWSWVASGFVSVPLTTESILAFTAIVVGLQTVFSAFFLSLVE